MLKQALTIAKDYAGNIITDAQLNYVTETRDWAIKWEGYYITKSLHGKIDGRLTTTARGLKNKIVHFGSVHTFAVPHESNKTVLSVFHIPPGNNEKIARTLKYIDLVHTSCEITRQELLRIGCQETKIVKIPIGVDLNIFKPVSEDIKQRLRASIGIPNGAKVIGSFQKDGEAWQEGLRPKHIKAPDVLVKVLGQLHREYSKDIFVLLLGAARGYVKKELERLGVPYKHIYLKNYQGIPKYYNMLDLYLITSRVEGVPKAILESTATGVPIVSTKVGIVPEVIKDGENGFIAEVDDVAGLFDKSTEVLGNEETAQRLRRNGLETVKEFSWDIIAERYYNEIYSRLL